MKTVVSRYKVIETIVIIVIWVLIFMSPFISYQQNGIILWDQIQLAWLKLSALLVVFIVNFYLLIPLLLYKKHYLRYTITLFALLPLVICLEQKIVEQLNQQPAITMPSMSKGSPIEFSNEMPPPEGYRVKQANSNPSPASRFWVNLLVAFLVAGTAAAYKLLFYWIQEEKRRKQIEERLELESEAQPEFILVKSDYKLIKIPTDDILFVESANEYIKIFRTNGEMVMTFMRLKNMENELPKDKFMRVQRSFIVNLTKIKAVEKNKIHLEHKKIIPVGEQYKEGFQEYLSTNFVK